MQLNYFQQKINYLPNDILSKSTRYRKSIQCTSNNNNNIFGLNTSSDYSSTSGYVVFVNYTLFCYITINDNTITRFQQKILDLNY